MIFDYPHAAEGYERVGPIADRGIKKAWDLVIRSNMASSTVLTDVETMTLPLWKIRARGPMFGSGK